MKQEKVEQKVGKRKAIFNINPIIFNRWSPRSMTGEELEDDIIMSLFEAARWASSSYNNQPWRFIYAKRNTIYWNQLFDLLLEPNKVWVKNAAVLITIISNKNFEFNGKFSVIHQFDTGAAWENLALEASSRNLVVHGMQGFDYVKARKILQVPDHFDILAMVAIGKKGLKENLPLGLQEKEEPNDRKPLTEIIMEGKFQE